MHQKTIIKLLIILTVLKILVIMVSYQKLICFSGKEAKICQGYGWNQLVENMKEGRYIMLSQSGKIPFYSEIGRPPLYTILLLIFTLIGKYAPLFAVSIQSIITSAIAFLFYLMAKNVFRDQRIQLIIVLIIFFLPLNFFKSGTVDEAPLYLLFLLSTIIYFNQYLATRNMCRLLFSSIFLGLAILTRVTVLPAVPFILFFLFIVEKGIHEKIRKTSLFCIMLVFTLSPWIIRNYLVSNRITLSSGGMRLVYLALTDDFIKKFPTQSIDKIEREHYINNFKEFAILQHMNEYERDDYFIKKALILIKKEPKRLIKSILNKNKIFIPFINKDRPTENENNLPKYRTIIYNIYGLVTLIALLIALLLRRANMIEVGITFCLLLGIYTTGMIIFIEIRHLYVVYIIMNFLSIQLLKPNNKIS